MPIITWSVRKPNCFIFHFCNVPEPFLRNTAPSLALPFPPYIQRCSQTDIAEKMRKGTLLTKMSLTWEKSPQSSEIMKPPQQPKK
ncbi:hypothetical protein TNCV_115111, partial [Trichonephila clavipes]